MTLAGDEPIEWLDRVRAHPEVRRMVRALSLSRRFHFYVLVCNGPRVARAAVSVAEEMLTAARGEAVAVRWLPYEAMRPSPPPISRELLTEEVLRPLSSPQGEHTGHGVLHVIQAMTTAAEAQAVWSWCFQRMNERRNAIVQGLGGELILCVPPSLEVRFASVAPDFWSIRSGTFTVDLEAPAQWAQWDRYDRYQSREEAEEERVQAERALAETRERLSKHAGDTGLREVVAMWLTRLGDSLQHLGQPEAADAAFREAGDVIESLLAVQPGRRDLQEQQAAIWSARSDITVLQGRTSEAETILRERVLSIAERLGNERGRAVTLGRIADVLQARGELDEALRIRRDEELPVYERLGDVRSRAVTLGKIADVLQARGELDEALRTLRGEVLLAFERLGDVRSRAVTLGKIADVLQARGELDEALRIRREEQLPVYERLGDVRSRAVTLGKIADVLQAHGELDEALRTLRGEVLLAFERLGDVRSRAVTLGQIADVLQARGELDEALRIRREEQLPVYERLGDVRERAVTLGKIADVLQARGELDEALRIRRDEELPVYERLGDVRSRAVTLGQIADVLQARGELDEALRIRREEQLPVYERLGDVRSRAVTLGKIADVLQAHGELEEARRMHEERMETFSRLGDIDGIAHTRWSLAQVSMAERRPLNEVVEHLIESYKLNLKLGRLEGICVVGAALGQVLANMGQPEEARVVLARSRDGFVKLGMPDLAAQVQALLDPFSVPST